MDNDKLISQLTVRLKEPVSDSTIGTGVLYYEEKLKDKVYIFTAAHCLFKDFKNKHFKEKLQSIKIDLYNNELDKYVPITIDRIDENLLFKDDDKDVAVIVVEKEKIIKIVGAIPNLNISNERQDHTDFMVKGFPNTTKGEELDVIYPVWNQEMTEVEKFQLKLKENYNEYHTRGFSGSGIFLIENDEISLFGIFTRFREEGSVIYCQYLSLINQLLTNNYLPNISSSYTSNYGLSPSFFDKHINKAIKNLGPRFDKVLNFKLPIAKLFNDLSFDNNFKARFYKVLDKWLMDYIYGNFSINSNLKYIDDEFIDLKAKVKKWGNEIPISIEEPVNIDWLISDVEAFNLKITEAEDKLYLIHNEAEEKFKKENQDTKVKYNSRPYEIDSDRLRKIKRANVGLLYNLEEKINLKLTNNPNLILEGEAGSGKSHLLGDIANEKLKNKIPVLLLLGPHFVADKTIEKNIIDQLDLKCSFDELLKDLNEIGKQIGSRVLILIDAINEGAGARLWRDQIQGFMSLFKDNPYIGLAISIRTTYMKSIISEAFDKDEITFRKHQGFKGNEYAALKMFCEFHSLRQPSFPILSPEFSNPLFLKIICEGVAKSKSKEFPQGFQGVSKIFSLFIDAVDEKLEKKRSVYKNRKLAVKVIHALAIKIFKSDNKNLSIEEAFTFMDEKFSKYDNLLNDLIEEGIFIKNIMKSYSGGEDKEAIYFAYEKLSDFYIANTLIKDFKNKEDLIEAFKQGSDLGNLLEDKYYYYSGVLQSLATLLPEMFNIEIFEVYAWVYEGMEEYKKLTPKEKHSYRELSNKVHISSWLGGFFLDSLSWRTKASVDNGKVKKWLEKDNHNIGNNDWFLKIVELTTIKGHPMNSDRLFNILSKYSMAERDSFWQDHLKYYSNLNDDDAGFPIKRLTDWAWSDGITNLIDEETARLCGQTLAWVLSSTKKELRDQTTKAMVNLLEEQPEALINILKKFKDIDDLYIQERLYAIAYGCVLRSTKDDGVELIAQYVYDTIFKHGTPPNHILLRDYARNVVEYARYKKIKLDFDLARIIPPYNSTMPKLPSDAEISKYYIDYESESFDKKLGHTYNNIHYSIMSWDFGNKTIDSKLHYFYPISFIVEKECKGFIKKLKKKQVELIKIYQELINLEKENIYNKDKLVISLGEESYNDQLKDLRSIKKKIILKIKKDVGEEKLDFIDNTLLKYWEDEIKIKSNRYSNRFDGKPFKRWIVQRVFELGYSMKLHGEYDRYIREYGHFSEETMIGRKYQWIALYEIMAVIGDNYKIERGSNWGREYEFYKGTWQSFLRDIDPISITKTNEEDEDEFDEEDIERFWYSKVEYNYWNESNSDWSKSIKDLPNPKDVLIKKDDKGSEWVYLDYYTTWKEPKSFGEERYHSKRKDLHYLIQGYLVKNEEKNDLVKYLENKSFFNLWMPQKGDSYSELFNREKFWAPAYLDSNQETVWSEIRDKTTGKIQKQKVMIATTSAKGSISEDKSGANINYDIPCKTLFEGLKLEYSSIDGDFVNEKGEKIVTNICGNGTLVRKEEFMSYLDENSLSIIWTVLGEKIAENESGGYHFLVPCGVFYIEDDVFKGELKMYERD